MSASQSAKTLVRSVVKPHLEPGDSVKQQLKTAYTVFRADGMNAGYSKVRRAWYGDACAPTYEALKARADELGLQAPAPSIDDQLIIRLASLRGVLMNAPDAEYFSPEIEAISDFLHECGHPVRPSSPPSRGMIPRSRR